MSAKKPLNQPIKKKPAPAKTKRDYYLIFAWLLILIVSIIRHRLTGVPFERDEGEYGYVGNLFLHGAAPFKNAYSMKLPGTSFMYAILMLIFGHTSTGVHTGMIFINAATMYFLYAAFKKIFNPFIALATSGIYGFMAINMAFDGFAAHATHFICFYSSIALWFLAGYMQSGRILRIFLCGLMFGMAFIMKQQAVFIVLFGAVFLFIYLIIEKRQNFLNTIVKLLLFGAGVLIPYSIVLLIVALSGQFSIFWLWTVKYASSYEAVKTWGLIVFFFKSSFVPAWDALNYFWVLALAGILVLYWSPYTRLQKLFALLYFLASACAVSSGFWFRPHYYVTVLPAVGLLSGIFIQFVMQQAGNKINFLKSPAVATLILSGILLYNIYTNRTYYFVYTPTQVCNLAYWGNPFNEAVEISKYINQNSNDTDKIVILGSEPEIYFYTHRPVATSYLYIYPLVENQPYNEIMQEEMINEIEKNKPTYLIWCAPIIWGVQPGAPQTIFKWADKYLNKYSSVGIIDFFGNRGWIYYWNDDIKNRPSQPPPDCSVYVLKRNPETK